MKKLFISTTWDAIDKRRNIKLKELDAKSQRLKDKNKDDCRKADKEVKKLARKYKRSYKEDIAKQEEAAEKKELTRSTLPVNQASQWKIQREHQHARER